VANAKATPAFFVADASGRVLTWDERCAALWGHASVAAQGLSMTALFDPAIDPRILAALAPGAVHKQSLALVQHNGDRMAAQLRCEKLSVAGQDLLQCTVTPEQDGARAALSLAKIIEGIPCLFFIADADGHLLAWNLHWADAVNLPARDLPRAQVADFFKRDELGPIRQKMRDALQHGHATHEAVMTSIRGVSTPYLFTFARRMLAGQPWLFCSGIDISANKANELRLRVNERAMDACVNALVITRREGASNPIQYVNSAFCQLTGYTKEECLGQDPSFMRAPNLDNAERSKIREALAANQSVHTVLRNRHKDGNIFWNDLSIDPVVGDDGVVSHFVAVVQDVTEARKAEEQLRHLAMHDQLTGLANRTVMQDRLQSSMERARRDNTRIAVVFIDLDNFKIINDTMGHAAGDILLQTLAQRLAASVRAGDTVARIGGDEFVAIINDCMGVDHVADIVGRLHANIIEPVANGANEISPSASIGVSIFPHDGDEAFTVLRAADAAMYRAKTSGKNQTKFYSGEMDLTVHNYLAREERLRGAIEREELFLEYQPRVDLGSGKMVGAEVLVRWRHPDDGVLMPKDFIRMAEESGLIIPLGEWVLNQAFADMKELHRAGFGHLTFSVNLSARQLRTKTFSGTVATLLRLHDIGCDALEVEVTESHLMDGTDQAALTLDSLNALGIRISIDDFGSGYSSLSHLQKFPIDVIKIDPSFLRDLRHSGHAVIAQAIIALAHNLHMRVVAEGVETDEQVAFLRMHYCDHMQGNYFSPAVSKTALLTLLRADASMPVH
jgi:diguanylate cyclase (GGDEF)-like protein/PAS domain S-box-containing protein